MTLALVAANSRYTVLVADRRLSTKRPPNGGEFRPIDDEFPKALVFESPTARLGVAFAGLARAPTLNMFFALPTALVDAAKFGPRPTDVVDEFARRIDHAFASLTASTPDDARRTAVLFAGYEYGDDGLPNGFLRKVSNYRDGSDARCGSFRAEVLDDMPPCYMAAVGAWQALPEPQRQQLAHLVEARRPPQAIVGKAVEVVRDAARSHRAQGTIGGQLLSLVVPADRREPATGAYHTETASDTIFFPGSVTIDEQGRGIAMMGGSVTSGALTEAQIRDQYRRGKLGLPADTTQRFPPIALPRVGRNHPCPCGSGEKYKRCHGR